MGDNVLRVFLTTELTNRKTVRKLNLGAIFNSNVFYVLIYFMILDMIIFDRIWLKNSSKMCHFIVFST